MMRSFWARTESRSACRPRSASNSSTSRYDKEKRRYQPTARRMTSGSNCLHLNRPETDDARSIGAAYQTTPAKLQHCPLNNPLPGAPSPSLAALNRRNLWSSISVSEPKTSSSASLLSLPISPPTAALAPWPSRNFTDSAKPKYEGSKPVTPLPPSSSPSPSTATRSAPWSPITSSCAQEKCVPVNASAISRSIQKKPARSTPLTTSASTVTNPISFPWIQKPSSKKLSNSWPATATSKKAWASWP